MSTKTSRSNHCYLWIPERVTALDEAVIDYSGPVPLRAWSLPRWTDPNVIPTFDELPIRNTDLTLEFVRLDYSYILIEKKIFYFSRFHRGNHWLRLEF